MLAVDIQRHAAGTQQLQPGRLRQPIGEQRCALQDMLAVVDDQEQPAGRQVGRDGCFGALVRRRGDAERAQNHIRHIGRGGHIGQWDEGNAIREQRHSLVRHLEREAALADPRRAHDRDQARGLQQRQQAGHVGGPTDQRQQWRRRQMHGGCRRQERLARQLESRLAGVGDGDLLIPARFSGQRQKLFHQVLFTLLKQGRHEQRGDDRQIGQAGAIFQTSDLFAAIADLAAHFILGQAGALAQKAQGFTEGIRKGVQHWRWHLLSVYHGTRESQNCTATHRQPPVQTAG